MLWGFYNEARKIGQNRIPSLAHAGVIAVDAGSQYLAVQRHLQRISRDAIDPRVTCKH